jgi:CPA2 family monovalent cation:H+ antiporter-2
MHLDPTLPAVVAALLGILLLGMALKRLGQPHVIGYLLAGMVLGPSGLELVTEPQTLERLGDLGVVLLLFFVGMDASPRELVRGWRVSVGGTLIQVAVSVAGVLLVGLWLDWPWTRSVLLGFIVSLSSTAVVLKLLDDGGEARTRVGRDVLGILLVQDLVVIVMLIAVAAMGGAAVSRVTLALQLFGGLLVVGLLAWVVGRESVSLPFAGLFKGDHEIEVFAALALCFGVASITGLLGLSTALGAFVAGMVVGAARETRWVHDSLAPFRVVFVALFFVSVGMLVDLAFVREHAGVLVLLVLLVFASNTVINAAILRLLGDNWRESVYAGALLSQIGEFSFVLAAVGLQVGILGHVGHQLAVAVVSLSLVASPMWIRLVRGVTGYKPPVRTSGAT